MLQQYIFQTICFPDSLNLWKESSLNKSGSIISELCFYNIFNKIMPNSLSLLVCYLKSKNRWKILLNFFERYVFLLRPSSNWNKNVA